MRVVSYNILDGGEGRADPLAEVLEAQRPDLVALVEADNPITLERIARRLNMDLIVGDARRHSVALLSRWPIQQSINHAGMNPGLSCCFLEATVLDPAGKPWPVGVVHLTAGAAETDEDVRMHDLAIILETFKPHRSGPHLLCGDFNATAPYQMIDPRKTKHKTQLSWKANGNQLPRRVVSAITAAGYLDTYSARHDERREFTGSFTTQNPGQRVDYIFAFGVPADAMKDAWVEQDRLAKYASDHFPVGAEIQLKI